MGIFRKKWRCVKCDTDHRKNPEECRNCGYTILQQVNSSKNGSQSKSETSRRISASKSTASKKWVCTRCKQEHDQEPSRCKVCGRDEFTVVGEGDSKSETQEVDQYDGPTFSSVKEVEEFEGQMSTPTNSSANYWRIAAKLVVFWIAVAAVLYLL